MLAIFCCAANYHKLSGLKQQTLVIPQFPWVRTPGLLQGPTGAGPVGLHFHLKAQLGKDLLGLSRM